MSPDTIVPSAGPLTVTPNDTIAASAWVIPGGGPGNPQELNRYSYALNNPARYTDPTGHCADPITLTLCIVAVGAVLVSGSLVAVNASSSAAQPSSGASAAPVAEQLYEDFVPFWVQVAVAAAPPLVATLRANAIEESDEEPAGPIGKLTKPNAGFWKRQGVDPEKLKQQHVGRSGAQYDVYIDDDGNVWILRKGETPDKAIWAGKDDNVLSDRDIKTDDRRDRRRGNDRQNRRDSDDDDGD